tara:strand:+ start:1245 stop:1895 length:651 start_codon:yes stop_codon:yes gene_type:complete
MKSVSIKGIARVDLGKKFAKRLRKEQNVPCVIYGGNEEPIHFYAHENEFRKIVYTPNVYLIDVVVGEKTFKTIMGDIQFHPVTDKIVHIDFLRIFDDQFVKINVPVDIIGNSIGVRNGGRLAVNMRRLLIEALPGDLPETIEIDITSLRIGTSIRVHELSRDNVKFLNNTDDVIVAVKTARAAVVEEEEIISTESGDEKPAESGDEKSAESGDSAS